MRPPDWLSAQSMPDGYRPATQPRFPVGRGDGTLAPDVAADPPQADRQHGHSGDETDDRRDIEDASPGASLRIQAIRPKLSRVGRAEHLRQQAKHVETECAVALQEIVCEQADIVA